jgi:hypothetical protein
MTGSQVRCRQHSFDFFCNIDVLNMQTSEPQNQHLLTCAAGKALHYQASQLFVLTAWD